MYEFHHAFFSDCLRPNRENLFVQMLLVAVTQAEAAQIPDRVINVVCYLLSDVKVGREA